MLTLIHAPRSRSSRFIWLLEELGADYAIKPVGIRRGDGSGAPDPDNPHPHKQVPALLHDGALVSESAAIALYLTDLFPDAGLGRSVSDPQRGEYLTWLFYYQGVVEPLASMHFAKLTEGNPGIEAQYQAMSRRIEEAVRDRPYLLGYTFSAVDVLYISMLQFARALLPPSPVIDAYAARGARPAQERAQAKDG